MGVSLNSRLESKEEEEAVASQAGLLWGRRHAKPPTPECWKGLPKVHLSLGAVVVKSHHRL